jgi:hypothetical protein
VAVKRNDKLEGVCRGAFGEARAAGCAWPLRCVRRLPTRREPSGVGSLLVIVGVLLLGHNLDWFNWPYWLPFETLWPLLLVAPGVGPIAKSRRALRAVPATPHRRAAGSPLAWPPLATATQNPGAPPANGVSVPSASRRQTSPAASAT